MVVNSPRRNRKDRAQRALDSPGHVNQQRTTPQHNKRHIPASPRPKYSRVRAGHTYQHVREISHLQNSQVRPSGPKEFAELNKATN